MLRICREQPVAGAPEEVFAFFADAFNLEAITPPWLRFRLCRVTPPGAPFERTPGPIDMGPGTLLEYRLRLHGVPIRWLTRIETWEPGRRFVDVQVRGPYRSWRHTHAFERAPAGTLVRDVVDYALPLGTLGTFAHRTFVRRDLERIFDYRQAAIALYFIK